MLLIIENDNPFLLNSGLVVDSTSMGEYQKSLNKAKAGLKALAMAKQF